MVISYEMVKEYTRALQQTRFDLSWDRDDPERHMITRARLTPDQIDAIDFRSYLACSSEEEEDEDEDEKKDKKKKKRNQKELPGKDSVDSTSKLSAEEEKKRKRAEKKKKIRDRYAGLLKSITSSVSRDANEIEVTFTPGLLDGDDKEKKDKKDKQEDLNVFQTELQKKRDRRRQASSASKDAPKELEEDQPFSDDEMPDDFFDEGFGASQKKSASTTSSSAVSKTSTRKRMTEEEKEAERKKKAELELLLLDRKELASSTKGDGASEKNMNVKKKKKKKGKDEKEKRVVGVDDERFSELYTRPGLFPLDPTNPKYKPETAKQIIQKRATVQKTIKESAVPDSSRASRSWGSSTPKDQTEGEKEDLLSLVASVKRKTREFEGVSDRVAKRPRN